MHENLPHPRSDLMFHPQRVSEYVMRATKITNTNYVELDLVVNEPDGVGITLPRLVYRWRNSFQPCETWMQ
jgi:hypothetical protein